MTCVADLHLDHNQQVYSLMRPRYFGRKIPDDLFKNIYFIENVLRISVKSVILVVSCQKSALDKKMACDHLFLEQG